MTLDEIMIWLLLIAGAICLVAFCLLIYAVGLLLEVRHKVKEFGPPAVERNGDWMNRKRQERL